MARENTKIPGIEESQRFLNFEAKFNMRGLVALLCIITLALSGVFSGGYFSETMSRNTTGNVTLQFERFGRLQTQLPLKISAILNHPGKTLTESAGDLIHFLKQNISGRNLTRCIAKEKRSIWFITRQKMSISYPSGYRLLPSNLVT